MSTLVRRRQDSIQRVRLGGGRDGRLTAIGHDTIAQTAPSADYADASGWSARSLYACANVATTHRLGGVHAPQPKPMRRPGLRTGSFALENAEGEPPLALRLPPVEPPLAHYRHRGPPEGPPRS